jgi:predicted nucleic acid-binding protein
VIVVDGSAVLDLLLNTRSALKVAERFFAPGETQNAPHLLEVAQVLRRYLLSGQIESARGSRHWKTWSICHCSAIRTTCSFPGSGSCVTAYDAAYIGLAEALSAPLVTRDHKLAASIGHGAQIEII